MKRTRETKPKRLDTKLNTSLKIKLAKKVNKNRSVSKICLFAEFRTSIPKKKFSVASTFLLVESSLLASQLSKKINNHTSRSRHSPGD